MTQLSGEVEAAIVALQIELNWPEMVPKYIEFKRGDGKVVFQQHQRLTIGDCEQAVEHYKRLALTAIKRKANPKTIARHVLWARIVRCKYIELIGKIDSTEADMPFAFGKYESEVPQ